MNKLFSEERDLLDSYENDEWESIVTSDEIEKYRAAAQQTFKKDKRVNIRMSELDIELLQEKVLNEGLPYQTLMPSVLYKYVTGRLIDKDT